MFYNGGWMPCMSVAKIPSIRRRRITIKTTIVWRREHVFVDNYITSHTIAINMSTSRLLAFIRQPRRTAEILLKYGASGHWRVYLCISHFILDFLVRLFTRYFVLQSHAIFVFYLNFILGSAHTIGSSYWMFSSFVRPYRTDRGLYSRNDVK